MSAIRALERMLAAGVPLQTAIELAKGFEADVTEYVAALAREMARDPRAEARKAKDAERQRLKRASTESADIRGHPPTSADSADASHACVSAQVVIPSSSSLRSEEGNPPPIPNGIGAPKGAEKARGTRLPDNWSPDEAGWAYAADQLGPDVDPARELDRFRDYWRAVPGAKARKADWPATWRNWCRTAAERLPRRSPHSAPSITDRIAAENAEVRRRLLEG